MHRVFLATSLSLLSIGVGCGDDDNGDEMMPDAGAPDMALSDAGDGGPNNGGDAGTDAGPTGEPFELTILHVNDHHSHLQPGSFDYDVSGLELQAEANPAGDPLTEVEVTYGGMPFFASLIEERTEANENVLKLHAGDAITGTLYYSLFAGRADAEVMNQICFDAFTLGNHEFDDGDQALANFLADLGSGSCGTEVLAANLEPGPSSPLQGSGIEPFTVVDFGTQSVGIIGINIAQKTLVSSNPDPGTDLLDETMTAQDNIDTLTGMGIDKIVLLTHYGYDNDVELAEALSGVDIVVGGDSHTLLGGSNLTDLGFNVGGEYPTVVQNADGDTACVVQAWQYTRFLGELRVSFDENGTVQDCMGNPVTPIDTEVFAYTFETAPDDEEDRVLEAADAQIVASALIDLPEVVTGSASQQMESLIAGFDDEVSVLEQTVISTAAEDLCLERFPGEGRSSAPCTRADTFLRGSDISNLVAKGFLMVTPTADIAIQNGGGVRTDVFEGPYTIADAFTLLPFSNTLVTLDLSGEQVVTVLEDALSNHIDDGGSTGSYPYASGLRYDVDASMPAGMRVSNVEVNTRLAGDWAPIEPTETYTVVTNDFIASGRDGYDTFGEVFDTGNFVDTFTEYAQGWIDFNEMVGTLERLPDEEYSTQSYINRMGCPHIPGNETVCVDY